MSELEIVPVDPYDEDAVRGWALAYELADRSDRGVNADPWTFEEAMLELQMRSEAVQRLAWAGVVDGRTVMALWLSLPQKENLHRGTAAIYVVDEFRRRGYGSEGLAHIESAAAAAGRTTIVVNAYWPYHLGSEGLGSPGAGFAATHSYSLALGGVQRRLDLPVAHDVLATLAEDAADQHAGYRIESFTGGIPDQYVAEWAALDALVDTDSPTGDLDLDPWSADVADVRDQEALTMNQGRTIFNAVAVTASGEVAAYTQMVVARDEPRAFQWGTLVRREDRGHRLGAAVKAANVALLQRERPDVQHIHTYNAESNEHMVAVNDALGFRPVERLGEFQKRLA